MEFLKEIMQKDRNYGVSVLSIFDDLPKECTHIFDLKNSNDNDLVYLKEIDKPLEKFKMDNLDFTLMKKSTKMLSNTLLKGVNSEYALPKMITFLEMFGVGKVEHLNSLKRWEENNPIQSLATPIGIGTDGELFYLDLHQKFQ